MPPHHLNQKLMARTLNIKLDGLHNSMSRYQSPELELRGQPPCILRPENMGMATWIRNAKKVRITVANAWLRGGNILKERRGVAQA